MGQGQATRLQGLLGWHCWQGTYTFHCAVSPTIEPGCKRILKWVTSVFLVLHLFVLQAFGRCYLLTCMKGLNQWTPRQSHLGTTTVRSLLVSGFHDFSRFLLFLTCCYIRVQFIMRMKLNSSEGLCFYHWKFQSSQVKPKLCVTYLWISSAMDVYSLQYAWLWWQRSTNNLESTEKKRSCDLISGLRVMNLESFSGGRRPWSYLSVFVSLYLNSLICEIAIVLAVWLEGLLH